MSGPITSRTPYEPSHPDALAVYCSDGRFTNAVAELLKTLGYDRLDTMTIPGGPALLDTGTASLMDVDVLRRGARLLIVAHEIKHVTLLAHEGCGYYKSQLSHEPPERIKERQLVDLKNAEAWVRAMHPGVGVAKFFARPGGGHVVFEPVD